MKVYGQELKILWDEDVVVALLLYQMGLRDMVEGERDEFKEGKRHRE